MHLLTSYNMQCFPPVCMVDKHSVTRSEALFLLLCLVCVVTNGDESATKMPDAEVQAYWFDMAESDPHVEPPWGTTSALQRTIQRSRQIRHCRIAPSDFYLELTPRERLLLKRRKDPSEKVDRGLLVEPGMTMFGVVNALLQHLRKNPLDPHEVRSVVADIAEEYRLLEQETQTTFAESQTRAAASQRASQTTSTLPPGGSQPLPAATTVGTKEVKEAPLLRVLKRLLEARDLSVVALTKKELRQKRNKIVAQDLIKHKRVVLMVDRQRPVMAAAMIDSKVSPHAVRESMHLLVPAAEPVPWRRRVQCIRGIDRLEVVVAMVYLQELDDGADDEVPAVPSTPAIRTAHVGGAASVSSASSDTSSSSASGHSRESSRARHDHGSKNIVSAPPCTEPLAVPRRKGRLLQLMPSAEEALKDHDEDESNDFLSTNDKRGSQCAANKTKSSSRYLDAVNLTALPHPIRRNDALTAAAITALQQQTLAAVPPVDLPSAERQRSKKRSRDAEASGDPPDVALCQRSVTRKVLTWMDPTEAEVLQFSRRLQQQREQQEADALRGLGVLCRFEKAGGSTKLIFPKSAHELTTGGGDPFAELPTISLPSKHKAPVNCKHSWTQRLVERERRSLLYSA